MRQHSLYTVAPHPDKVAFAFSKLSLASEYEGKAMVLIMSESGASLGSLMRAISLVKCTESKSGCTTLSVASMTTRSGSLTEWKLLEPRLI